MGKISSFAKRPAHAVAKPVASVHGRYREKHPKKKDPYFDGELHGKRFLLYMVRNSLFVYLYIEIFARITTGPFEFVKFIISNPIVFIYNWLIVFTTMTICLLFKKRKFVLLIINLIWIALGTANGMILIKRMTPFTLYDVQNAGDGLTIVTNYFSRPQLILAIAVLGLGLALVVIKFITATKWQNVKYKKAVLEISLTLVLCLGSSSLLINNGILSTFFGNLNYAYRDYGFPYCFINTSLNKGIARPDNYSKESIQKLLEEKTVNGTSTIPESLDDNADHPNVIVLQMESFTLAQDYNHISVDKDPTPVFSDLMNNYTGGWFEVPACGAGTANTEFEVLTGISAKLFGPGEYPYKGELRTKTLENMAFLLKNHGYATSALHDHRALFYNRDEVYANLGFDSYTSIEYMNNITKTPTGWAKDEILTDNIMDIMTSTETRDFMHVVSVEGHGAYPTYQVFKKPYVNVTCDNEEQKWRYEYYLNEVYEMDKFIGDLIDSINEAGEPTVMIIYGDHIPALDVKEKEYADGNLYKTRYVIWDNIGLEKEDQDITAFQSGAILMEKAGYENEGIIFDYQQNNEFGTKAYHDDIAAIAYDMLYGKNFVYNGKNPFKRADMKNGFKDIEINDIVKIGEDYYIKGKNFTEHSRISMDGEVLSTIYLSPTLLGLEDSIDPKEVSKLEVSQIDTKDDTVLTTINFLEEL